MNIGEAAKASGVNAKKIRHYEENGLISKANRSGAGYRVYRDEDVHILRFVHRARNLGFSLPEIKTLLNLWGNRRRASADVKKLALKHVSELDKKIKEMQAMRKTLVNLSHHCQGDLRPECPILEDLSGESGKPSH